MALDEKGFSCAGGGVAAGGGVWRGRAAGWGGDGGFAQARWGEGGGGDGDGRHDRGGGVFREGTVPLLRHAAGRLPGGGAGQGGGDGF